LLFGSLTINNHAMNIGTGSMLRKRHIKLTLARKPENTRCIVQFPLD